MRNKKRTALLCAVLMFISVLSGCKSDPDRFKTPEFSFNSSAFSSGSSTTDPAPESSVESTFSGSFSQSSPEAPKTPEIPNENGKIILDPINERTVVCDKNTLVLTGTVSGGKKPSLNIPHTETYSENNGTFTYTAKIRENFTGYGQLSVIENGSVRVYAQNGNICVVEVPDVEEANEKAVKNAIDQPLDQVAEYIAVNADKEKLSQVFGQIEEISNKICAGISDDYDKLRAISRWVSENIYYDYKAFDDGVPAETLTLEYMLENSSSVCGGYSNMTSALAAVQGIKVCNVHGSAVNNNLTFGEREPAYHEWNYAVIDGRVVWIDSGWNSYCYRNRDGSYDKGKAGVKYFDISSAVLAQNHKAKYAEYRDYFAALA